MRVFLTLQAEARATIVVHRLGWAEGPWALAELCRFHGDQARDNVCMRDRLLKVLKKVTTEPVNIGDEDSLFESGLLDSFALPDLVSGLEEEFSFKVPDADLNPRKFDSIARIEAYLSEHADHA
jgi:acyl carrier protein